jgi:Bacterial RNA polymerase, alpha chain C terminal domain
MGGMQTTVWLPDNLWKLVRLQANREGGVNAVIIRALEEYLGSLHRKRGRLNPGKYKRLVASLSLPVAELHLSARPAACLRLLGVQYVYDVVTKTSVDLRIHWNFGEKSLREVQDKLAVLGLTLGMTPDRPSYAAAVTAVLLENLRAAKR